MEDDFYIKFEEKFRGSRSFIKERLGVYLPCINILKDINSDVLALDLGCGRGEWLELLIENNWHVLGIDINKEMVNECKQRNIPAICENVVDYLVNQGDSSISLITGFHIVEHLSFDDLLCLVKNAHRVLKPGGILILETPNPENILVSTCNFYLDPSHKNPIPPGLLQFLTENAGFVRSEVFRLNGAEYNENENFLSRLLLWYYYANLDYSIIAQKEYTDTKYKKCLDLINIKPQAFDLLIEKIDNKSIEFENMKKQLQDMRGQQENMKKQLQDMRGQQENMKKQLQDMKKQNMMLYKWSLLHLYDQIRGRK